MNYYRRYVGDYLRDTARLSMIEHGAYTLLMDYYYADERALSADKDEIYLMVRAMTPADRKAVDKVLALYFTLEDDGYHQARIDEELARAHDASESARKAGEKGAANRWAKPKPPPTDGGSHSGGDSEPYSGPHDGGHNETDSGSDSETDGEVMAKPMATRAGDPTTNHQPPTPNLQPPNLLTPVSKLETSAARASRLPPGWEPDADLWRWTQEQAPSWPESRRRLEVERFRDYWHAKGGKDAAKLDWRATWRNWVRKAAEMGPSAKGQTPRTDPKAIDLILGNSDACH